MSIRKDGVNFERTSRVGGRGFFAGLLILEAVFSFFLYLTLAGHIFAPDQGQAAAGVPQLLSYQGRLTDTSGNPLGGTGTTYCFRYSIYDAASGGNKLWPSGTPTNATTTVVDGVFSDQVGRADTLNMDFFATSTIYLNVDVNTVTSTCAGSWESLTPRQQITAAGYALSADDVYGAALRTPTSTKVQIGTGLGVTSGQTLLSLDVKNTTDTIGGACSDNGALWYNSTTSRALVCEANKIQNLSNSDVVTGLLTNSTTTIISGGNVVFSNSNGVSFGQSGSTITASVNAGGGGATISSFEPFPFQGTGTGSISLSSNTSAGQMMFPFAVPQYVAAEFLAIPVSMNFTTGGTSAFSQSGTLQWGLFTRPTGANSTRLSNAGSGSLSYAVSYNNSSITFSQATSTNSTGYGYGVTNSAGLNITSGYTGLKQFNLYLGSTLTPGQYWLGLFHRNSSSSFSSGIRMSLYGNSITLSGLAPMGSFSSAYSTGANLQLNQGGNWALGNASYTVAGQTILTGDVTISQMTQNLTVRPYIKFATRV